MKKIFDYITIALFCLTIFIIPIMTIVEEPVLFSPFENRNLATEPEFAANQLFEGAYLPLWDKYMSDQIWGRNEFITAYTNININILKKTVINKIVIQNDLLLPFTPYSSENYDFTEQIDAMTGNLELLDNKVKSYGGKFIYIGVPEQSSMLREYYPNFLNNNDKKLSLIETGFFSQLKQRNVSYINMKEEFLKSGDYTQYYSKIDHHYNLFGAFLTYRTILNEINADLPLPTLSENEIDFIPIKNTFYGSRSRRLYNVYNANEHLYYYIAKNTIPFSRMDNGEIIPPIVFNLPSDDYTPVTYNIYMNGDIAETLINTNRKNLPNVLIFGDSFTNALETILYNSFNETRSLDLRYYGKKTIMEYIDEFKPDFVFCMRDDTAYLNTEGNGNIK